MSIAYVNVLHQPILVKGAVLINYYQKENDTKQIKWQERAESHPKHQSFYRKNLSLNIRIEILTEVQLISLMTKNDRVLTENFPKISV